MYGDLNTRWKYACNFVDVEIACTNHQTGAWEDSSLDTVVKAISVSTEQHVTIKVGHPGS
jgi:hypothetical protein